MGLVGKADHKFPKIEDKYNDRFIEISEKNKHELEEILEGKILFTPGHTKDSISLKLDNMIFCGDAAMNGIPSIHRFIIWIEDTIQYENSWKILFNEDVEWIYPAHGQPFKKEDLMKYIKYISKIKLYKLK